MRRIRKSKNTEPAVFARVRVEVESVPFQDMTLPEVIAATLVKPGGRELTVTELAAHFSEAGYETSITGKALRTAIGAELRRYPERICQDGSKWLQKSNAAKILRGKHYAASLSRLAYLCAKYIATPATM